MKRFALLGITVLWLAAAHATSSTPSKVVDSELVSQRLQGNRIGIDPRRTLRVYLPPGYDTSKKSYPVIYYLHSIFWSNRQMFEDGGVQRLFDRAITGGSIREFILVAADFTTPHVGTFFGNAPATGQWEDFVVDELVPYVDAHFRTLTSVESRGITGDFLGGYAAFKFAMLHPDKFSAVYALHPVGTGQGLIPIASRFDWRKVNTARSWDDLANDGYAQVFTAMAQAYLPNPNRPPFYCDYVVELKDNVLTLNPANAQRLYSSFLLDQLVPLHVENLRKLRGIKFDWGRYDANPDHVYSNQAFTRVLDQYGIEHEAEEYRGNHYEKNWTEHGRVEDSLLPFFNRHLSFESPQAKH
ncbi:MAG: alpha/beta hydrolase [Povalibacter sp.]